MLKPKLASLLGRSLNDHTILSSHYTESSKYNPNFAGVKSAGVILRLPTPPQGKPSLGPDIKTHKNNANSKVDISGLWVYSIVPLLLLHSLFVYWFNYYSNKIVLISWS